MLFVIARFIQSVLRIVNFIILIYCVMSIIMPQSNIFRTAARYVEPILSPFRTFLFRVFPSLGRLSVDFTPMFFLLVLEVAGWLINLIFSILL